MPKSILSLVVEGSWFPIEPCVSISYFSQFMIQWYKMPKGVGNDGLSTYNRFYVLWIFRQDCAQWYFDCVISLVALQQVVIGDETSR